MLRVVLDMVMMLSGLVILLAATALLAASARREVSLRSAAALCIGGGAIWTMVQALQPYPRQPADVLLPLGVALWVLYAAWAHRGRTIGSATDFGALMDSGDGVGR